MDLKNINSYIFISAYNIVANEENKISRQGLFILYDYLQDLEDETEEKIQIDIMLIAKNYYELNIQEIKQYNKKINNNNIYNYFDFVLYNEHNNKYIIDITTKNF